MEKDKFQPIAMPCTKEQYKSLIPVLEQHNIKYDRYQGTFDGIVNNFNDNINSIGKVTRVNDIYFHEVIMNRKIYQKFNRKIFLKSLGIIEEPEFVLPEKWCIKRTIKNHIIINEFFEKKENNIIDWSFISSNTYVTSSHINCRYWIYTTRFKPEGYTEITFEQFQKYVLKQETSLLESQSVTNKQTNTMVKATVEESQPKEKIHKGCLIKWKDIVGIVTSTNNDKSINIISLSKGISQAYNINMEVDNVSLFKGKLTLEQ